MLPISSTTGAWTPALEALFTATSAVCVTGLVVVDTGTYWSGFGQVVILVLIQLGWLGFMTSSTLLLVLIGVRRDAARSGSCCARRSGRRARLGLRARAAGHRVHAGRRG